MATHDGADRTGRARMARPVTRERLNRAALRYLERFAASADSVRRVLMRRVERSARLHGTDREEGEAWVAEIVERLCRSGALDDGVYAAGRATTLLRQGRPARAIRASLLAKGVGDDDIGAALDQLRADHEREDGDVDDIAARAYAKRRRLGPFRRRNASTEPPPQEAQERRRKDLAAMARAGFRAETIRRVLDADPEEVPDWE